MPRHAHAVLYTLAQSAEALMNCPPLLRPSLHRRAKPSQAKPCSIQKLVARIAMARASCVCLQLCLTRHSMTFRKRCQAMAATRCTAFALPNLTECASSLALRHSTSRRSADGMVAESNVHRQSVPTLQMNVHDGCTACCRLDCTELCAVPTLQPCLWEDSPHMLITPSLHMRV